MPKTLQQQLHTAISLQSCKHMRTFSRIIRAAFTHFPSGYAPTRLPRQLDLSVVYSEAFSRCSSFLVDTWWLVCGDRVKVTQVRRWRMKNPSSIADDARRHIAEEAAASYLNAVARRNRQFLHVVRQTNSLWRPRVVIAFYKVYFTELYLFANVIKCQCLL